MNNDEKSTTITKTTNIPNIPTIPSIPSIPNPPDISKMHMPSSIVNQEVYKKNKYSGLSNQG